MQLFFRVVHLWAASHQPASSCARLGASGTLVLTKPSRCRGRSVARYASASVTQPLCRQRRSFGFAVAVSCAASAFRAGRFCFGRFARSVGVHSPLLSHRALREPSSSSQNAPRLAPVVPPPTQSNSRSEGSLPPAQFGQRPNRMSNVRRHKPSGSHLDRHRFAVANLVPEVPRFGLAFRDTHLPVRVEAVASRPFQIILCRCYVGLGHGSSQLWRLHG
jgi:hypothetical protein